MRYEFINLNSYLLIKDNQTGFIFPRKLFSVIEAEMTIDRLNSGN